jgi:hypothetical protein
MDENMGCDVYKPLAIYVITYGKKKITPAEDRDDRAAAHTIRAG